MFQRGIDLLTSATQRRNRNDQENQWQGQEINDRKDPFQTRIMFHNIHHLKLHGVDGLEMFIHAQSAIQADIQAFSEHCLDTTKYEVIQTSREILRKTHQAPATIQLDSSSEPAANHYKPGGTGILLLGHTATRLEPQGKGGDPLGRWSYIHLRRKHLPPVTLISVYQVCPRPTNLIGNTAFHQQQRALHLQGRSLHPRKAFIEDLHKLLQSLQTQDHDIIVGGDFNESLQDKNSGILQLATAHQLVDPFLHRFPHKPEFGTHITGHRRIDIAFVTTRLLGCITSIGYGPYEHGHPSDHRPLIIDFKTSALFGEELQEGTTMLTRGVRTNDKNSVTTFVNQTYTEIARRGGFELQSRVDDDTATPETIELLDSIIGNSEQIAEDRCRRRRPEYYSRIITQQRMEVSLLRNHLRALKQCRDRTTQLRQKMQRTGVFVSLPETQKLTIKALQDASARLQETRKKSFQIRHAELDARIQNGDASENKIKITALKNIKKTEQVRKTYRILKAMREASGLVQKLDRVEIPRSWPPQGEPITSISELEDPKICTDWRTITEPKEIEYYLMIRNRLHFGQAEGTPFTQPPLQHDIDWQASTLATEQLLQGTYASNIPIAQCNEVLQACRAATELDTIPHALSLEDFRGKICSWRESTTTSPSGRHLGRYKALFTTLPNFSPDNDQEELPFATKQESIAHLKLSLINYCIRNTYVLQRWKTVINVMIFKDHGDFRIHRLRVIHIYEADFNAVLAIKWRKLLHFATSHNLVNEGQYGGRPGCEAQSLTLLEELKYDLAYMTRRTLFNFDNDATSCYDRIVVPLASIINRKYGLDRRIVAIHAATLNQARFRLRTATGVSDLHYSHCTQFPIHGTGQGSGNSPCIWLFISSTLFDLHAKLAHGAKFVSPDGKSTVTISMIGFVDDSTGTFNDFRPTSQAPLQQLFQAMQSDAQLWNDLLFSTGGKLELPKCSFHVLHFDFLPNGRPVPSLERFDNRIYLQDAETGRQIPIKAKRSFEPHKTLGHQKSPYSATSTTIKELQTKADRLALVVALSPINRQGAYLAYQTVFIPSVRYTLPQSFFPRKLLESAETPSIRKIIAKCGFNRNTARPLIYAPRAYGGGGFLPWYLLQGEGQILHFLKHWRTKTILSRTLHMAVQWAQWQSGHEMSILDDVNTPLPYLECRWLRSLREFLRTINATLHIDDKTVMAPERRHDIHIMKFARSCGLFDSHDLAIINYCRLYLHVTTVSELFDAAGTSIIPSLFYCNREPWFNPQTYVTLQERPSEFQIQTKWQRLCRQWTTSGGAIGESMPLGEWTEDGNNLRRRRETYATNDNMQEIYHWHRGCYWKYETSSINPTVYSPSYPSEWQPTISCTPVTTKPHIGSKIVIDRLPPRPRSSPRTQPATTFSAYVNTLSQWEQHLLQGIHFRFRPYEILHRLTNVDCNKKVYLVSDGSHAGNNLTYGWVFGNDDGDIYAEHSGQGFGTPSSHRAEAWGMLSATRFIHRLQMYTQTAFPHTEKNFTIFSDNAGLIRRVNQRRTHVESYPNATLAPDWDLVEQLFITVSALPQNPTVTWIKGHQDNTNQELSIPAQFNVRADHLAGSSHQDIRHSSSASTSFVPAERCRLYVNNQPIQGNYIQAIRHAYTVPPYQAYLSTRHKWSKQTLQQVDWEAYTKACTTTVISKVQLSKLVHDKLPTSYELSKVNPLVNPTCRHCQDTETFSHLMQCTNAISTQFRDNLTQQLQVYFCSTGAPDSFSDSFFALMEYWVRNQNSDSPTEENNPIATSQKGIGWHMLPKGFLSLEWRHRYEQAHQLYSTTTLQSSVDFIAGLIKVLWTAQMQLWKEHLAAAGKDVSAGSPRSADKLLEYRTRIRTLHSRRHECLNAHRELYFHPDVELFLSTATISQMKDYLLQYEPVIYHSIREAKRITIRSILTFTGFTRRQPTQPTVPRFRTITPSNIFPATTSTATTSTAATGGSFPHKHTRWRKTTTAAFRSIREFFSSPPD